MSKQRELMDFLVLSQKIENLDCSLSTCRKELVKIAGDKLKVRRLLSNVDKSSEKYNELINMEKELVAKRQELLNLRTQYKKGQQQMIEEMTSIYRRLINIYSAWISQFEFDHILKRNSQTRWQLQKIQSWEGCKVGWVYVNEKDPKYNKPILVETSIVENSVTIENSDTMKIVFATVLDDTDAIEERWDWFDYFLYSVSGFYTDKKLMEYYADFLERDRDFAEYVSSIIKEDIFTDPIFGTDLYAEQLERVQEEAQQ